MKRILGALAVIVTVLVGAAYFLPRDVHVTRSIVIARPAAAVFPFLNSLRRCNEWSPWKDIDPNVTNVFSGAETGIGAHMAWVGNSKVGSGTQTITDSVENKRVLVDLDFGDRGVAKASWLLSPAGEGTRVEWTLDSSMGDNPIGRYMGLFMDRMMGPDYERGLANLKQRVESIAAAYSAGAQPASDSTTAPKAETN